MYYVQYLLHNSFTLLSPLVTSDSASGISNSFKHVPWQHKSHVSFFSYDNPVIRNQTQSQFIVVRLPCRQQQKLYKHYPCCLCESPERQGVCGWENTKNGFCIPADFHSTTLPPSSNGMWGLVHLSSSTSTFLLHNTNINEKHFPSPNVTPHQ